MPVGEDGRVHDGLLGHLNHAEFAARSLVGVDERLHAGEGHRVADHGGLRHARADGHGIVHAFGPTILAHGSGGYIAKSEINQSPARPLCATMAKMHRACQDNYYSDDYILGNNDTERIRKLTPRECARLQGFSDEFKIQVSNAQAYKQFGNAVTVNVSRAVALKIREKLEEIGEWY